MSEQDRKGAPVGAGLGEQDAYARGGGGVIIEPVIVEAVGEASGSGSRIVQVDLDTGHYQRTANWEECAPSTLDGGGVGSSGGTIFEYPHPDIPGLLVVHVRSVVAHMSPRNMRSRATAAHSLLIFVTDPESADVLAGDLVETMARVRARHSARLAWFWFWWQLGWIAVHQIIARIKDKTALGKLGEAIIKRIGG